MIPPETHAELVLSQLNRLPTAQVLPLVGGLALTTHVGALGLVVKNELPILDGLPLTILLTCSPMTYIATVGSDKVVPVTWSEIDVSELWIVATFTFLDESTITARNGDCLCELHSAL